ncbi:alpha/beta hydrolase [Algoriphagus halophytocola]|uniref:Alpha/beta hydrolase n=1 Tax=Algoriphagus halophytocola TaxID=2991499 RepID=A0ABY6MNB3_9BACT|nr:MULTISPECIES: alpha/beta hydrolase [unclassified Algoriphagus]UZD23816.1 alpha/beta hydrolase [Algoriphagus sp. TR-M5]WBL41183.1 alpha/beta hydrolase [Algoriphagus sp. TR-M9]
MLRKIFLGIFALAMILAITYMLGPKLNKETLTISYPEVPTRVAELEEYIHQREDSVIGLKEGNQAYIHWADSSNKRKTPYSIVYIHGFGASPMEGDPVHRFVASHFGANLFVTRLPEHGIRRENGMEYLSPQALADAAGEAYQIGKSLGDEVIVIGTSMGGALTLLLASQQPDIKAVAVYSPAIRDYGNKLEALFSPWSGKLMEKTMMENSVIHQQREGEKAAYWSEHYHLHAYESLAQILYGNMTPATFEKIKQPLFLAYYYKDEEAQDRVVSVPEMKKMYEELGTPESLKRERAFPNAGDHVIASSITSGDWEGVMFATIDFLEKVVGIPAKPEYQEMIDGLMEVQDSMGKIEQ